MIKEDNKICNKYLSRLNNLTLSDDSLRWVPEGPRTHRNFRASRNHTETTRPQNTRETLRSFGGALVGTGVATIRDNYRPRLGELCCRRKGKDVSFGPGV